MSCITEHPAPTIWSSRCTPFAWGQALLLCSSHVTLFLKPFGERKKEGRCLLQKNHGRMPMTVQYHCFGRTYAVQSRLTHYTRISWKATAFLHRTRVSRENTTIQVTSDWLILVGYSILFLYIYYMYIIDFNKPYKTRELRKFIARWQPYRSVTDTGKTVNNMVMKGIFWRRSNIDNQLTRSNQSASHVLRFRPGWQPPRSCPPFFACCRTASRWSKAVARVIPVLRQAASWVPIVDGKTLTRVKQWLISR